LLELSAYVRDPSARFRAVGPDAEVKMARELPTGKAQAVSTEDFNERTKRLFADKPDPRKAEPRTKSAKVNLPFKKE
jgi:hypothetical protein